MRVEVEIEMKPSELTKEFVHELACFTKAAAIDVSIGNETWHYIWISDTEYQFFLEGNMPTNYVLDNTDPNKYCPECGKSGFDFEEGCSVCGFPHKKDWPFEPWLTGPEDLWPDDMETEPPFDNEQA